MALSVLLLWLFVWGNRPPQMGADEDVFKTVDALFTAITAHDEKLLGQCDQRLHSYKNAGKLSVAATKYLNSVIQTARAGRWESAAERLYDFMMAQRREGPREPLHKKRKPGGPIK